jgi:6-pyruvoyltetrahydropterin/6-carboxytetrahydropterin synthase
MSAAENERTYGKCNNPHGHGHNYKLEITVAGQVQPQTGMVCNVAELDEFVEREILTRYEHANLNVLEEFEQQVPTTENLCIQIFERAQGGFQQAKVEKVRIEETLMNSFEYAGVNQLRH